MSLREYKRKRNFRRTSEPEPKLAKRQGRSYVIQKHAASHLHYDFRLELDGVLKSWAVPKGPSLDPSVKRLAMHVEDHPVKYGDFEGIIPEGEYGGGTVMLWDRGTWEPVGDPHTSYRTGKFKFKLHGEKLRGGWMLAKRSRSTTGKDNEWFLFKERDEEARTDGRQIVDDQPLSIASGRDLDQIAVDQDKVWRSNRTNGKLSAKPKRAAMKRKTRKAKSIEVPSGLQGAKRSAMPRRVEAQLATLAKEAPNGDQWVHEIKFDGYRMLCRVQDGKAQFISRNQKNWTTDLDYLSQVAARLPVKQAILDGEVVAFKADGATDFQALQNVFSEGRVHELVYYVFDVLYLNGIDLRGVPLTERKALLEEIVSAADSQTAIRFSEHFVGNGPQFFQKAAKLGLEGIICKLADRPYVGGRSTDWLKVKANQREEFVIGGFTDPGVRGGFGALLLGYYNPERELVYAGKVGTGFTDALLESLRKRLDAMVQKESPFVDVRRPVGEAKGAHWVRPQLVAQIAFTEWTRGGHLRHPSFLGLREDKVASSVKRDKALKASEAQEVKSAKRAAKSKPAKRGNKPATFQATENGEGLLAGVRITNPDKVLFGEGKITKLELAQYYLSIARWILPHVANRPLSLVRCPEGAGKKCFFQKHPGVGTPETIRLVPVKEKDKTRDYLIVDKIEDLVSLAQIGALEIHVWGSQADKLEFPDRMFFDLDPDPTVPWGRVVESTHQIRAFLEEVGLKSFVKTTGGKGLHVVVPLQRRHDWDEVKGFSKAIAELIERVDPKRYTSNMSKAARTGKIFVDYLRNGRTATAIAAFSTRAKPRASVSVPLSWDELTPDIHSDTFTIRNLPERLDSLNKDPWARIGSIKQSLTKAIKAKLGVQ
jgi:bifunctional non-homologous end joining protein LigD